MLHGRRYEIISAEFQFEVHWVLIFFVYLEMFEVCLLMIVTCVVAQEHRHLALFCLFQEYFHLWV